MKEILYIDMDGVIADYDKAALGKTKYETHAKGFFENLGPIPGAIDCVNKLHNSGLYDIYFLSTAPWSNVYAWTEKRLWLEKHFEEDICFKKLILSHNKSLLRGEYLIDDRLVNGVDKFQGLHVHFGSKRFPDWSAVLPYFIPTF